MQQAPRIAAVVLAAGLSRRFGRDNKLLADIGGGPLLRRVVEQARRSQAARLLVVTGHEADRVAAALASLDIELVHNPDYLLGMGTSVAAAIRAIMAESSIAGALVLLGDMPEIDAALLDRIMAAFAQSGGDRIVFPVDGEGRQRNPVLWPRALFAELVRLDGDTGGRDLIARHPGLALPLAVGDASAVSLDIDTPQALADWRRRHP